MGNASIVDFLVMGNSDSCNRAEKMVIYKLFYGVLCKRSCVGFSTSILLHSRIYGKTIEVNLTLQGCQYYMFIFGETRTMQIAYKLFNLTFISMKVMCRKICHFPPFNWCHN